MPGQCHQKDDKHELLKHGDDDIIELLLSQGRAEINYVHGETVQLLADACRHEDADLVARLLRHGANPNVTVKAHSKHVYGMACVTPLIIAEVLLAHGAVPSRQLLAQDATWYSSKAAYRRFRDVFRSPP